MTEKKKEERIGVDDSDIVTAPYFDWLKGKAAGAEDGTPKEGAPEDREPEGPQETEGELPVRPKKRRRAAKEGLPRGWQRVTWVVRDEYAETLRALSAWTGEEIKDILDVILEGYFSRPDIAKVVKKALEFARSRRETLEDLKV